VRGHFNRLHRRRLLSFSRCNSRCEFDRHQVGNTKIQEKR
jgi:formamidase